MLRFRSPLAVALTVAFSAAWLPVRAEAPPPQMQQGFLPYSVSRLDGSSIDASLMRPSQQQGPVILMLQGSSCASEREGFAALTQEWRPRFGLLYIPKPGATADAACGQGYLARNTIDQRLIDVLRVIQRLRTETWWNHELYVIGTSEGGLMAGLVGAFVPETKRIAILSYGGARTMGEWWPEAVYAHALKESGSTVAAEAEREEVIEAFQRARLSPDSAETFGGATNTLAWWASIIDVRLLPTLLDVEVPILLVHGTEDPYAPVEGARGVERAFAAAGKTNLTYREYAGLNHGFENAAGESSLERVTQDALLWTLGPPNGL